MSNLNNASKELKEFLCQYFKQKPRLPITASYGDHYIDELNKFARENQLEYPELDYQRQTSGYGICACNG